MCTCGFAVSFGAVILVNEQIGKKLYLFSVSINQSINQSVSQSVSQSINQSVNQSFNQSKNHSITQLIVKITSPGYVAN